MSRRRPGSGSVTARPDGSYLLRWHQLRRRRSRVLRGVTENEAHETMNGIMVQLAETGEGAAPSLRRYAERLLDDWEIGGRADMPATRSRWRLHVSAAPFVDRDLGDVGPGDVRRWLDRLMRAGVGQQQRRHCAPTRALASRQHPRCRRPPALHSANTS